MKIILVSGKRFSGKTWLIKNAIKLLRSTYICQYLSPTNSTKKVFCQTYGLNYHKMLYDRAYKEKNRKKLTLFYEERIQKDVHYFDKKMIEEMMEEERKTSVDFLFIDIRLTRQLDFFQNQFSGLCPLRNRCYKCISIRKEATESERKKRGWIYDPEIDDKFYETDLDHYSAWDGIFTGKTEEELERFLKNLLF